MHAVSRKLALREPSKIMQSDPMLRRSIKSASIWGKTITLRVSDARLEVEPESSKKFPRHRVATANCSRSSVTRLVARFSSRNTHL